VGMEKDTKNQRLPKSSFQTFLNYLRSLQVEVEQPFARWLDVSLATIFSNLQRIYPRPFAVIVF